MSARQAFISVIISTRNRKERLRRCLSSLTAQGYPRDRWELIVVEDGDQEPVDEVMLCLQDRLPLRWFRVSHAGCGGAKNAGASQARGHYLVFTDPIRDEDQWFRVRGILRGWRAQKDLRPGRSAGDSLRRPV